MADEPDWDEFEGPSKSAVKREMSALQALGERLTRLPENQLKKIPIEDERLREAVMLARRITARSGLRRQLQYIGKLMRDIDPEPIASALAGLDQQSQADKAYFHKLEGLRDELLENGDAGLETTLKVLPQADRQHLRQMIRQHQAEKKNGKPPSAARKLFKYLRQLADAGEDPQFPD